jgi:biotin transporter BioY
MPRAHILYIAGSLAVGQLLIFGLGMIWLSFYVGVSKAFLLGVVPFLSGAALKNYHRVARTPILTEGISKDDSGFGVC